MLESEEAYEVEEQLRKRRKNRNFIQEFLKSHPSDYFAIKLPFGIAFGATLGYGKLPYLFKSFVLCKVEM